MEGPGLCLQGDYGTYADACGIGGSPALSPRMPWETYRCRGRLWVGPYPFSASALDRWCV